MKQACKHELSVFDEKLYNNNTYSLKKVCIFLGLIACTQCTDAAFPMHVA